MKNFLANKIKKKKCCTTLTTSSDKLEYDDVINLSIGDPDLTTPKPILDAMYKDALNGHTHYTNTKGYYELRQAICTEYLQEYNIQIDPEEILVTASATHAMFIILSTILNKNDEVLVIDPYFYSYKDQIEFLQGKIVTVSTTNSFRIDKTAIENAITNKTKAIIINTPCNPTGICFNTRDLDLIVEIAIKYNILIISDDIYTIFSYNNEFQPLLKYNEIKNNLITIRSFSKDFCMTGFRIGYIIANKEMIYNINLVNDVTMYCAPSISQRAALYAITHKKELQKNIIEEFKKRTQYAFQRANEIPFFSVTKSEGSIYMFIDIRKSKMTSDEFVKWCYDKFHIIVLPGSLFGISGEGYIRLSLTVSISILKEAFDRFKNIKD